jgi:hypothetical protein
LTGNPEVAACLAGPMLSAHPHAMVRAVVSVDARDRRQGKITARRVRGVVTALLSLVPCWYLAAFTSGVAHAAFNGCWLSCGGERNPAGGVFATIFGALLLGAPFAAGMWVARVRSRAAWASVAVLVLLAGIGQIVFSLDPNNTDYFVR